MSGTVKIIGCVEIRPTEQSIYFADDFISLTKLAKVTGLDRGYLSRVFSCKRKPSLKASVKIAAAFKITLGNFAMALAAHEAQIIHYGELEQSKYAKTPTPEPPSVTKCD